MKKHKLMLAGILLVAVILAGVFVPLGSYTSQGLCPTGALPPTVRLSLIRGQTIRHQKSLDRNYWLVPGFEAECTISVHYVQYLF